VTPPTAPPAPSAVTALRTLVSPTRSLPRTPTRKLSPCTCFYIKHSSLLMTPTHVVTSPGPTSASDPLAAPRSSLNWAYEAIVCVRLYFGVCTALVYWSEANTVGIRWKETTMTVSLCEWLGLLRCVGDIHSFGKLFEYLLLLFRLSRPKLILTRATFPLRLRFHCSCLHLS
jgi:hypothetical protein